MMEVLVRYSSSKLLRGLLISAVFIAVLCAMPWLVYGNLASFFRSSDVTYAWIAGLAWCVPALVLLVAVYGYRLLRHRGCGIALGDSGLTVIGLRKRSFARPTITAVQTVDGKPGVIAITISGGIERRIDVSMMAGTAETIASTVRDALWTRGNT